MAIYDAEGNELYAVYDAEGTELDYAYDAEGNVIYSRGAKPFEPSLILLHSEPMSNIGTGTITPQGLTVYGDYYFQFFTGDNKMRVFNKHTHEKVGEYSATNIKHANTMQFGDVVQDNGFPLLYVSEWGDSGTVDSKVIDVLKIDLNGYQIVESFTLPSSGGYHPSFVGDWANNVGYAVGFETSQSPAVTQQNIITKYNLSDMSILEQYQVPYMGVLNGWEYYNGKLIYCGNTWDGATAIFSFIDVNTHEVTQYTFDKTTDEEYEGYAVDENILLISNWVRTNNVLYYRIFAMNLTGDGFSEKSLSILGDSISTYSGYIPSGNANYYTGSNCGVTSVNQTWWKRVIDSLGMTLNLNNSWSGSRVSTTNGTESAGVTRASNLGTNPNVIIVYMGINDFNNEVATATFRSAYSTMLDNIKTAYPYAEVYCATLPVCERNGASGDPEINDDGVYLSEYNQIITEVATTKDVSILDFANCGITYANMSTYMGDWESATGKALHPNADGHVLIAQKAIVDLQS